MKPAAPSPVQEIPGQHRSRLVLLGLALVTILLYLPIRHYGFIPYDDGEYITDNRMVQSGVTSEGLRWAFSTTHASLWIPVTWISHMVDCQLFGVDPSAHHTINLLVHTVNAVLVFVVFLRMTGAVWPCAFAAALFAWHPLRVESVAWAAERKDLLCAFFGLLALWAYAAYARPESQNGGATGKPSGTADPGLRRPKSSRLWYGAALLAFALGLMSKPMLVTWPFVLLLLDIWPLKRLPSGPAFQWRVAVPLLVEKLPFFALSLAVSVITAMAAHAEAVATQSHPLTARLGNAVLAYGKYLLHTILPLDLAVIYPLSTTVSWGGVAGAGAALAVITWLCWGARATRPWWIIGWLWFVGMLVPVSGIMQVGTQSMADRFTYLALLGLTLAAALELAQVAKRLELPTGGVAVLAAFILGGCLLGTHRQLEFWRDAEMLFIRTIEVTGPNAAAEANLGVALEQKGKKDEARHRYETALRLMPNLALVHNNLANLLDEAGERETALTHYKQAVELRPRALLPRLNLGSALVHLGRWDEGREQYEQGARVAPADPRPHYLMGRAYLRQNNPLEASARFREALRRDPNDVRTLLLLARVLAADPEAAARNGQEALTLANRLKALTDASNPVVLDTLGMALAETGRFDEAKNAVQTAINQCTAAGDTNSVVELRERLKRYNQGQAFRERAGAGAGQ